LKIHHKKRSGTAFPCLLKTLGSLLASCSVLLFSPLAAHAAAISGDSTTIFRIRQTTDDRNLFPLYEYLHLSGTSVGKEGTTSFQLGGWARGDLGDNSTGENSNGDLQYGFLSYRADKNNLQFSVGRQYVAEGVAYEKIDGLYLRSDIAKGFTAAAFVGSPVVTEPNFTGGDIIYGARLAQGWSNYYTIGISALKNDSGGDRLREEEGVDLWLRPIKQIDIAGRSTYNSITDGFMEHAYTASFTPIDTLRFSATLSQINYRDYFYHVTTSALSLTNGILDPNEEVLALGGSVGYTPFKMLGLSADYKHYDYDIAGSANYFGGKANFTLPDALSAGLSYHRMDGDSDRLKYDEYRAWASKKLGPADLTLDCIDIYFDNSINGIHNTYSIAVAAGYDFSPKVRVAADVDFLRSSDFDQEFRGLIKVTYVFDSERRAKSEK
jgi:hypothetical protein